MAGHADTSAHTHTHTIAMATGVLTSIGGLCMNNRLSQTLILDNYSGKWNSTHTRFQCQTQQLPALPKAACSLPPYKVGGPQVNFWHDASNDR